MLNIFKLSLSLFIVFSLISCAPRGESKSLTEVYKAEMDRYSETFQAKPVADLATLDATLKSISKDLSSSKQKDLQMVVSELDKLITKAGYTSRPALTEIRNQYEHLAVSNNGNKAAVTLLLARTYSLLADELSTVAFSL